MLSFIFLVGGAFDPRLGDIWRSFFRRCPAAHERVVVGNASAVAMVGGARFVPARWRNARFSLDMVRLMNSGVEAADPRSTAVFVSATSVPVQPCAVFFDRLENVTTARLSFHLIPPCTKGSQWIALPVATWNLIYTAAMQAGQPLQCRHLAPDENLLHSMLWHERGRVDADTHAVAWGAFPVGGHPLTLTTEAVAEANARGYLMARKFEADRAIFNYSFIH